LVAAAVRVFGTLTLNGEPAPDVTMAISSQSGARQDGIAVASDASGYYEAQLPGPGRFNLSFRSRKFAFMGNDRQFEAVPGDNPLDWALEGARLTIDVKNADPNERLSLSIARRGTSNGLVRSSQPVAPDELPLVLTGLAFGEYAVEARQQARDRRDKVAGAIVTLTPDQMDISVSIVLNERRVLATVIDSSGQPVIGATLRAGGTLMTITAAESPAAFVIEGAAEGARLVAHAPGFIQKCQSVPNASAMAIQLDAGRTVTLVYSGDSNLKAPVGRIRWSGSDCTQTLSALSYDGPIISPDGSVRFVIKNFPSVDRALFSNSLSAEAWQPLNVPPDRVVRLAASGPK
jgi:hypothetical protein